MGAILVQSSSILQPHLIPTSLVLQHQIALSILSSSICDHPFRACAAGDTCESPMGYDCTKALPQIIDMIGQSTERDARLHLENRNDTDIHNVLKHV